MTSTNINNNIGITYKGIVDLKFKLKNKVILKTRCNTGTSTLFDNICKFLTGNTVGNWNIPKYITIYRAATEAEFASNKTSCLTQMQALTATNYGDCTATYTGVIRYENLISEIEDTDTRCYRLYLLSGFDSDKNQSELAYISVTAAELSKIIAGTSLIVEWKMLFKNDNT